MRKRKCVPRNAHIRYVYEIMRRKPQEHNQKIAILVIDKCDQRQIFL